MVRNYKPRNSSNGDKMRAIELTENKFYHGTSSCLLETIKEDGFSSPSYFVKDFDVASEYAAMGGEWDLQDREEKYEEKYGTPPREIFDVWEMYEKLYPVGCYPIVIEVLIPNNVMQFADAGGHGSEAISLNNCSGVKINSIHKVKW